MDIIFKIIGVGLITCIAVLIIKPVRSDFAMLISLVGGIVILVMILSSLAAAVNIIKSIATQTGVNSQLLSLVFKMLVMIGRDITKITTLPPSRTLSPSPELPVSAHKLAVNSVR